MVTGNQKVKTPAGWNSTRGAWVKTGADTWKDVDQIYVKTPTGWNNASGQAIVQSTLSLYCKWSTTIYCKCTTTLSLYCK